jgi:hypothetical protein
MRVMSAVHFLSSQSLSRTLQFPAKKQIPVSLLVPGIIAPLVVVLVVVMMIMICETCLGWIGVFILS